MSMDETVVLFLKTLGQERDFSANTVAAYRNDLVQFAGFLRSQHGLNGWHELTDDHLRAYDLHLRERDYAKSTVARKIAALKSFCGFLNEHYGRKLDPARSLSTPRVEKVVPEAITEDEVRLLLSAVDRQRGAGGLRDRAMLRTLYATGMRVSELTALDLGDFDPLSGVIRCGRKPDRLREIPLSAEAIEALASYLGDGRGTLTQGDESALFVNQRGSRLTRQGFWLILKTYAEESNLPEITPHTLRHTFAAHAVGNGAALQEVQQILGHVSIATTQVYQQVAQRVGGALVPSGIPCYDSAGTE